MVSIFIKTGKGFPNWSFTGTATLICFSSLVHKPFNKIYTRAENLTPTTITLIRHRVTVLLTANAQWGATVENTVFLVRTPRWNYWSVSLQPDLESINYAKYINNYIPGMSNEIEPANLFRSAKWTEELFMVHCRMSSWNLIFLWWAPEINIQSDCAPANFRMGFPLVSF